MLDFSHLTFDQADGEVASVVRLYLGGMLRTPDLGGVEGWVNAIDSGKLNFAQVADNFTWSTENRSVYNEISTHEMVKALYHNVLGRDGSAAEVTGWEDAAHNGNLSWGDLLRGFTESAEFKEKTASLVNDIVKDIEHGTLVSHAIVAPDDIYGHGPVTIVGTSILHTDYATA